MSTSGLGFSALTTRASIGVHVKNVVPPERNAVFLYVLVRRCRGVYHGNPAPCKMELKGHRQCPEHAPRIDLTFECASRLGLQESNVPHGLNESLHPISMLNDGLGQVSEFKSRVVLEGLLCIRGKDPLSSDYKVWDSRPLRFGASPEHEESR